MRIKTVFCSRLGILVSLLIVTTTFGALLFFYNRVDESRPDESEVMFHQAEQAIHSNNLPTAKKYLKISLKHNPEHVMARLYYGQILREDGETSRAVEIWQSIQKGLPTEVATARFLQGSVAIEQGFVDQSRDLLLEALQLNPDYLAAREKLVLVYQMLRRPEQLVAQLNQISKSRRLTRQELILRTIPLDAGFPTDESIRVLNTTLQNNPNDLESLVALILTLRESGDYEQALEFLQSIPPDQRQQKELQAQHVLLLVEMNKIANARQLCESVDIGDTDAYSLKMCEACGRLAYKQEDWETAVKSLYQAYLTNPNDRENCYYLGLSLQRLGRHNDANQLIQRSVLLDNVNRLCVRLTQESPSGNEQLLTIYKQIGLDLKNLSRYSESAHWLFLACQLAPNNTELRQQYLAVRTQSENLVSEPTPEIKLSDTHAKSKKQLGVITKTHPPPPESRRDKANIQFVDLHKQIGLEFSYFNGETGFQHLIESMGGGVIVIDYDGDGWEDLYFPQGCKLPFSQASSEHIDRLYRNIEGQEFQDVTIASGLGSNRYGLGGVAWDFNNDGYDDLFVSNFGKNTFYINNGDGTFTDITEQLGLNEQEMSTSVAAADFNADGFQDLYITNYVSELKTCPLPDGSYRPCDPASFSGQADRLLMNDGSGNFIDVSRPAGIDLPDGKGLGVIACDFNTDGRIDIYVSNDGVPNFLFRNVTKPGESIPIFEEIGLISGTALDEQGRAQAGMGIAVADFNQDSQPDLYVTNFYLEHNVYYRNEGNFLFKDDTRASGLFEPTISLLGFGTQGRDFDGDGYPDLFVANGHIMRDKSGKQPWKMSSQIFQNQANGKFLETSKFAGNYFQQKNLGRGVAAIDWNHDNKQDLVVVHQNRPVSLLQNDTSILNEVTTVRLVGTESNRNGIGARIQIASSIPPHNYRVCGDGGYLSCNSRNRCITIDKNRDRTKVLIHWPNGKQTKHLITKPSHKDHLANRKQWQLSEDGNTVEILFP